MIASSELWASQFANFCEEIFEEKYDYYIFITRKCYHFANALYKNKKKELNTKERIILRDRDLIKEMDFSKLKGKKILLIDDTVIYGTTIIKYVNLLKEKTKKVEETVIDAVAFAITCDLLNKKFFKERFQGNSFRYLNLLPEREISDFISVEMETIHDQMIPYVIDLPVLKTFQISEEKLREITTSSNFKWNYYENDFTIGNSSIYRNGIFIYKNEYLERKLAKILLEFTVKCRYSYKKESEKGEKNIIEIQLTPFAMFRSAPYDGMRKLFFALFEGTSYADRIQKNGYQKEKDYVTIYRGVVYNISYYLGLLFLNYLKESFKIDIRVDISSYQMPLVGHINQEFEESIKEIFQDFSIENYLGRLGQFHCFEGARNWDLRDYDFKENSDIFYEEVEQYISGEIAIEKTTLVEKRIQEQEGKSKITAENILEKMKKTFTFQNPSQFRVFASKIMLKLLDKSVLSNVLSYDENSNKIMREFQFGECSDVYIDYRSEVFYVGIYAYYNAVRGNYSVFRRNYQIFLKKFKTFLLENSYFELGYISMKDFLYFAKFYDLEKEVLIKELENKRILLESNLSAERIYIKDIMNFIFQQEFE